MRILAVNAFAKRVGGAEVYMHRLVDELRVRGHRAAVFATDANDEVDEGELRVVKRPEWDTATLFHDDAFSLAFRRFVERFRPDVIHVHNLYHLPVDAVLEIAATGVPTVQMVHDFGLLCPNSWCVVPDGTVCEGGAGKKCFERGCEAHYPYDARVVLMTKLRYEWTKRAFHGFVAPSRFLADKLAAHGFPTPEVLPLWVEPKVANVQLPGEAPIERDAKWVLFMGRLVREKGVEYLVRAWPLVLRRHPDARLTIVGDGPERGSLEALARELGLDAGSLFAGRINNEAVDAWFRRATCQVLPSIWCENSPVTTYESYLAGLPMIASDIAGLPAMVREGETGLLARPRDAADLAAKIVRLLDDPALQQKLQAGCRASVALYGKEQHVTRLLEIFQRVIDAPRRSPAVESLTDHDLVGTMDELFRELAKVERWALDMKKHIDYLEQQDKAGQPVEKFGRHLRYMIKSRRAKARERG